MNEQTFSIDDNGRGFRRATADTYLDSENEPGNRLVVAESSAIGDYEDALKKPGSSFLWVGSYHHLCRGEIRVLAGLLLHWLQKGRLPEQCPTGNCVWTDDGEGTWESSCGVLWSFLDGEGPIENGMRFCHSCGKSLEAVEFEDEVEVEDE